MVYIVSKFCTIKEVVLRKLKEENKYGIQDIGRKRFRINAGSIKR